jgi:hypothetical protein
MLNILEKVSKLKKNKITVYSENGENIGNHRHNIPANKE